MGCTASKNIHDEELNELKEYVKQVENKSHEQQNLLRFKIEVLVNMLSVEEKRNDATSKRLETLKWLLHAQGITEDSINILVTKLDEEGRENAHSIIEKSQLLKSPNLVDITEAIQRMREEFELFRDDILHSFAESNGKIIPHLPANDFMKQIYTVTENISKGDLQIIALRFDDGHGLVSIPEFLEFFMIPEDIRVAKSAASAVRMSLDLLSFDVELLGEGKEEEQENEKNQGNTLLKGGKGKESISQSLRREKDKTLMSKSIDTSRLYDEDASKELRMSHFTNSLDRSAKRMLLMWGFIKEELQKVLAMFKEKDQSEPIISIELFHKALQEICGPFSLVLDKYMKEGKLFLVGSKTIPKALQSAPSSSSSAGNVKDKSKSISSTASSPSSSSSKKKDPTKKKADDDEDDMEDPMSKLPQIEALDETDITFLIERFELGGFIHYMTFIQYFDDLYMRWLKYGKKFIHLSNEMIGVSPFRWTSEWSALKQQNVLRQSFPNKKAMDGNNDKVFTAPKKPVTAPPATATATVVTADGKKVDPPAEKKEPTKEPVKKVEEKKEEKEAKEGDKKLDGKEKEKPKPKDDIPTAPVVQSSGCFGGCGLGGGKKDAKKPHLAPVDAPAKAESKGEDKKDTGDAKSPAISIDTSPGESKTKEEGKHDESILTPEDDDEKPVLKKDTEFHTPKAAKQRKPAPKLRIDDGDDSSAGIPERDGLGHADKMDSTISKGKNNSRFRRRADRDFDQEKETPQQNDSDELLDSNDDSKLPSVRGRK